MTIDPRQAHHQQLQHDLELQAGTLPLCEKPTDIVMGQGNLHAQLMFIGEAPGENEALQRVPFVGRAGQLLNRTLTEIGIAREDCYVTNIVKARPPGNRDPLPNEIAAYLPTLFAEIELIQPTLIATLGRFSMNFFLPDAKISALHGVLQRFRWEGSITYVFPLYHPAAALRGTTILEAFRADVAKLPKALEWVAKKRIEDQELQRVESAVLGLE